jgi:hypothetical protein
MNNENAMEGTESEKINLSKISNESTLNINTEDNTEEL